MCNLCFGCFDLLLASDFFSLFSLLLVFALFDAGGVHSAKSSGTYGVV